MSRARNGSGGRGQYDAPILIGLTAEQRAAVQAAATRAQRSVGDWARLTLLAAAEETRGVRAALRGSTR